MTKLITAAFAALLMVGAGTTAHASDAGDVTTLEGNIVCGKCTLKTEGLTDCHNVLISSNAEGEDVQYWLVKNDVDKRFGDVCMAKRPVSVTGTIEEKDGKHWIAATTIEPRSGS